MHVTHVVQEFYPAFGGGPLAVYLRAKYLSSKGVRNTVLTSNILNTRTNETIKAGRSTLDGIEVVRMKALNINPFYIVVPSLPRELLRIDTDVIHVYGYGYFSTEVASFIGHLRGIPVIFSPCGYFPKTVKTGRLLTGIYNFMSRRNSLFYSSRVLVESVDDTIIYRNYTDETKINILPGPTLSEKIFTQEIEKDLFRKEYNINSDYFLCLGRMTEAKGFHNVINAFPEYRKITGDTETKLIIAGADQGYGKALENLIKKLNLSDSILIIRDLNEKFKVSALSGASIFILPSDYETYGNVVNEAMAVGTPVICTKFGGASEKIPDNEMKFVIDPKDRSEMSRAMKEARNLNETERANMKSEYINRLKKGHTVESSSAMLIELYNKLTKLI